MEKDVNLSADIPALMDENTPFQKNFRFPPIASTLRPYLSLKRWLPIAATAVIIWFLLRQIQPQEVWRLLTQADAKWVMIGCCFYLLTNIFRCYRFGVLLPMTGWQRPLRLLPEMITLSFLNNVLPARGGELSFPYLMNRRRRQPPANGQ